MTFGPTPEDSPNSALVLVAVLLYLVDKPIIFVYFISRFDQSRVIELFAETVESLFYMYRLTGDSKYQDMGWDVFEVKWLL